MTLSVCGSALANGDVQGKQAAPARQVAAVYVRTVVIDLEGPRKGTPHSAFEIRYTDGRYSWIGAYPDGNFKNFTQPSGRLLCMFNAETSSASAVYQEVARGAGAVKFARSLIDGCARFDRGLRIQYEALGSESNDNQFVDAMLHAQGYLK